MTQRTGLQAHLARLREHERALGLNRPAKQDGVRVGDQRLKPSATCFQRLLAQILTVNLQKIESNERR